MASFVPAARLAWQVFGALLLWCQPVAANLMGKSKAVALNKCIDTINVINEASGQGNSYACLDCDPTMGDCYAGCQVRVGRSPGLASPHSSCRLSKYTC